MSAVQDGRLGKYAIVGTLGRGAMGTVYDGHDPVIDRRVAIKTIPLSSAADDAEAADELARFKREAQAAGRLQHPNIVGVYDYGETETLAYIVMEFVDGTSLKALLDRGERMAPAEAVRIMQQLLAGMQYSHERGVVHRDIKPANVMITSGGVVKIADFGIARIESSSLTQAGTIMGTPAYMSPEQFMGQTVDARTDIYSAGVLLYQLLTGERPFEGSMTAIMHKALNTVPPRPSEMSVTAPPGLDAVVATAMAKRPEQRYATAAAFSQALAEGFAAAPIPPGEPDGDATMVVPARRDASATLPPSRPPVPAPVPAPAPTQRSRTPLLVGAGVAALLAVGAVGYLALRPGAVPKLASPQQVATVTGPSTNPAAAPAAPPEPTAAAPLPAAPVVAPPDVATAAPPVHVSAPEIVPAPAVETPPSPPVAVPGPAPKVATNTAPAIPEPPPPAERPPVAPAPVAPASVAPAPLTSIPVTPIPVTPIPAAPTTVAPSPAAPTSVAVAPAAPIAPPKPPPAPDKPVQVAVANTAASLRAAVEAAIAPVGCALLNGDVTGGEVRLDGVIASGSAPALHGALAQAAPSAPAEMRVASFDGPYCGLLDVLRPVAARFGQSGGALPLGLKGDGGPLRKDAYLIPQITMPPWGAYLTVDYFQSDGTMAHLAPADAAARAHEYSAGTTVTLGDPAHGAKGWQVDVPFGTDMMVAIASAKPLFAKLRPDDDTPATYLAALKAALAAASRRGERVAAGAVVVRTVAR